MNVVDLVLFYHSNCKPPHVAGVARICKSAYPDFTAQDPDSKYFDVKATPENPSWIMVDIEPIVEMESVGLPDMKENEALAGMPLLQRGQRLSVQPVSKDQFEIVCKMGRLSNNEWK